MTFVDHTIRCRVCGKVRALHQHHVFTRQAVRRAHGDELDPRNALGTCIECHGLHHLSGPGRIPIPTAKLRDENLRFMTVLIGVGPTVEYLRRNYADADSDPRVARLAARLESSQGAPET